MATRERKMRKLEPMGITKWKKGMVAAGTIKEIRASTSDRFEGKGHLLDLVLPSGGIQTYGCPTILHNYLRQIEIGEYVEITCLGKVSVPRGRAWDFDVSVVDNTSDDDEGEDGDQ